MTDSDTRYSDLGSDSHAKRLNPERRKQAHIHQLETPAQGHR